MQKKYSHAFGLFAHRAFHGVISTSLPLLLKTEISHVLDLLPFLKKQLSLIKDNLHKLAFLLHCPHIHQKPMSFKQHKIQSLLSAINSSQGTLSFPGFCVNVSDSAKYNVNYDNLSASLLSVPPTLLLAEVSCSAARGILTLQCSVILT